MSMTRFSWNLGQNKKNSQRLEGKSTWNEGGFLTGRFV